MGSVEEMSDSNVEQEREVDQELEEEEAEDDEEEEDEDEGEVGGMDSMGFVDDILGCEAFQQIKQFDYQALSEKKRKALHDQQGGSSKKPKQDDIFGAQFEEILETMTRRRRRKSKLLKKRGRRKGYRKKLSPEITKKLGDATLHYACGRYSEAISLLDEVVWVAPYVSDAHHTLGLIYSVMGDKERAMCFYFIAALLTPKDPSLWKLLISWSIEQGYTSQATCCLEKAITADPTDISLRFDRALLHIELGDYLKAAKSYDQIITLCPANIEARKMAAKMYQRCGQIEKAVSTLENYISEHFSEDDDSVVNMLMFICMRNNLYAKGLEVYERARSLFSSEEKIPLSLTVKAGICLSCLGNVDKSEHIFQSLLKEPLEDNGDLVMEVADSYLSLGHYESALKYYHLLEGTAYDKGRLALKIGECYISLKENQKAIFYHSKALSIMKNNIDARITLSSLLVQEDRIDEAVTLLSPPKDPENVEPSDSSAMNRGKPWWIEGRIKIQLAKIYHGRGMLEEFVDTIYQAVSETLLIEAMNEKIPTKKRPTTSDLSKRAKLLDDQEGSVMRVRSIAPPSELVKAHRAQKALQKREIIMKERKAKAQASGVELCEDDLEEEPSPKKPQEPPLPGLLKEEVQISLVMNLCKALASLRRYWEAMEIINNVLASSCKMIPDEKRKELASLRAQIAYNATDPKHGYDFVRSIVLRHPNSYAAWNCYYKVVSRLDYQLPKHGKFMQMCEKNVELFNCIPPMIIHGHQFTMNAQHQDAARKYLQAHKLQPDDPLVNLCTGTALINLALGFRLKNKHLTVIQGFGFLYKYLHVCNHSQEALYNVARACQHVGLVTIAASYYERVLEMEEKDNPVPRLPNEVCFSETQNPGYCDLKREAAYNLHLIYKKSGAVDLARQVLKVYCRT